MPTYDFKCGLDDTVFEVVLPIEERNDTNVECPTCGKYFTHRLLTFKGLTWAPTAGGMR